MKKYSYGLISALNESFNKDIQEKRAKTLKESQKLKESVFEIDYAPDDTDLSNEESIVQSVKEWLGPLANTVNVYVEEVHGPGSGWPVVRLSGDKGEIAKFLYKNYNSGEDSVQDTLDLYLIESAGRKMTKEEFHKEFGDGCNVEVINAGREPEERIEIIDEAVSENEMIQLHQQIESAEDIDEIQEIIYTISDGVLEDEVQRAYDQSLVDGDSLDDMKGFVLSTLEDNAEYLDESQTLNETGEWDDNDEEMQLWLEDLRLQAEEIARNIDGEVKIVKGFDAYQGPFAIIHSPKHGDIELWYDREDDTGRSFNAKVAHVGWIGGGINNIADLLNQDEIPETEIINEAEDLCNKQILNEDSYEFDKLVQGEDLYFRDSEGTPLLGHYASNYPKVEDYDEGLLPENGATKEEYQDAKNAEQSGDVWEFLIVDENTLEPTSEVYTYIYGNNALYDFVTTQLRPVKVKKSLEESNLLNNLDITLENFKPESVYLFNKLIRADLLELAQDDSDGDYIIVDFYKKDGKDYKLIDEESETEIYTGGSVDNFMSNLKDYAESVKDQYLEESDNIEDSRENPELEKLVRKELSSGKIPDEIQYKGKTYKAFNVMSSDTDGKYSQIYFCNMENTPSGNPQESNDYFFVQVELNPSDEGYKGVKEIKFVEDLTESQIDDIKKKLRDYQDKENAKYEEITDRPEDFRKDNPTKKKITKLVDKTKLTEERTHKVLHKGDEFVNPNGVKCVITSVDNEHLLDGEPQVTYKIGKDYKCYKQSSVLGMLDQNRYKLNEEATFKDKVKAIKKTLLKDKRKTNKSAQKSAENIAGSMVKEEDLVLVNTTTAEPDYVITDVTELEDTNLGDVQSPDIDAMLTMIQESIKDVYGPDSIKIHIHSSNLLENGSFALVDIQTPEILKEFEKVNSKDTAVGKSLILENKSHGLYEFRVNNTSGTTRYIKRTKEPAKAIYEWLETEFLSEAKKAKEEEKKVHYRAKLEDTINQFLSTNKDLQLAIETIKMYIEAVGKEGKEAIKPMIEKIAVEFPVGVTTTDDSLKFDSREDIIELLFGKEWIPEEPKEVEPSAPGTEVIKESIKIGDKVEIINSNDLHNGNKGEVTYIDDEITTVKLDNGRSFNYDKNQVKKLTESYQQFNIGEIDVVYNPETQEVMYSVGADDKHDKKINLTKIPSVDIPYNTETIIKHHIELQYGPIPEEIENDVEEGEGEELPLPQEEPTQENMEDEVPMTEEDNEISQDAGLDQSTPEEDEALEDSKSETGSAKFQKIKPNSEISVEDIRTNELDGTVQADSQYIVVEEINLDDAQFTEFSNDVSKPQDFFTGVTPLDRKNYPFNVVKITNSNSPYDIVADPVGYSYGRYVAVIDKGI